MLAATPERRQRVVAALAAYGRLSAKDAALILRVSRQGAGQLLRALEGQGVLTSELVEAPTSQGAVPCRFFRLSVGVEVG